MKALLIIALSLITVGAITGTGYRQVKGLVDEGKQLSSVGKYGEAQSKLTQAQSQWFSYFLKDEIAQELISGKKLVESSESFEQGKIQYDTKNYQRAIEYFNKVLPTDINFNFAKNYKELAETSIEQQKKVKKGVVAGASTQPTPNVTQVIQPTPIPTQTPKVEDQILKDSRCKNSASLGRIQFEDQMGKKVQSDMPELFSFAAAKQKYPEQWTSQSVDEFTMMQMWAKSAKPQADMYFAGIKNEGEKLYYQLYNACLTE